MPTFVCILLTELCFEKLFIAIYIYIYIYIYISTKIQNTGQTFNFCQGNAEILKTTCAKELTTNPFQILSQQFSIPWNYVGKWLQNWNIPLQRRKILGMIYDRFAISKRFVWEQKLRKCNNILCGNKKPPSLTEGLRILLL